MHTRTALRSSTPPRTPVLSLFLASLMTLSATACSHLSAPTETGEETAVPAPVLVEGAAAPVEVDHPEAALAIPTTPEAAWTDLELPRAETDCACIWPRMVAGFRIPPVEDRRVTVQRDWYADHRDYLDRVFDRAGPYLHYILTEIEARGMPTEIALLPVVESAFDPFAYSHGRAAGLWQIIPGTGRRFGLKQGWWYDGRRDPVESTRAALDYLEYLHEYFDGDWLLALAAYNTGEGRVARAVRANERRRRPTDFWNLSLPAETRAYVPKLLAIADIIREPQTYAYEPPDIADTPYLDKVELDTQVDLALVAEMTDMDLKQIYLLNAGYNRWATDPDGPSHVVLPVDKAQAFRDAIAEVPPRERVSWIRHEIRPGETLSSIASRYHTTVGTLQKSNGIRGHIIRAGDSITVPTARAEASRYSMSADVRMSRTQSTARDDVRLDHVVRPGDSLWEISRRYEVGVRELAKWNGMAPSDPLRVGRELVVWVDDEARVAQDRSWAGPAMEDRIRTINYAVRRGDSLSRIANRFRVSVADLIGWNGIDPSEYLHPGQRLRLRIDVTEQN